MERGVHVRVRRTRYDDHETTKGGMTMNEVNAKKEEQLTEGTMMKRNFLQMK